MKLRLPSTTVMSALPAVLSSRKRMRNSLVMMAFAAELAPKNSKLPAAPPTIVAVPAELLWLNVTPPAFVIVATSAVVLPKNCRAPLFMNSALSAELALSKCTVPTVVIVALPPLISIPAPLKMNVLPPAMVKL